MINSINCMYTIMITQKYVQHFCIQTKNLSPKIEIQSIKKIQNLVLDKKIQNLALEKKYNSYIYKDSSAKSLQCDPQNPYNAMYEALAPGDQVSFQTHNSPLASPVKKSPLMAL